MSEVTKEMIENKADSICEFLHRSKPDRASLIYGIRAGVNLARDNESESLQKENAALKEIIRMGLDLVEQLEDQACIKPGEYDDFTEKAREAIGSENE